MSRYSVYFGAQTNNATAVAPPLAARGIMLLRQSPATVQLDMIPDINQPGYSTYKTHLPHFITSFREHKRVALCNPCSMLPETEIDNMPYAKLPPVIFGWNVPIGEEVKDSLRARFDARNINSQGKGGMVIDAVDINVLRDIRETHAEPTFPTTYDTANLAAIGRMILCYRILYNFLCMQQYPAFVDENHYNNFLTYIAELSTPTAEVMGDPERQTEFRVNSDTVARVADGVRQQSVLVTSLEEYDPRRVIMDPTDDILIGGLHFPFLVELSNDDKTTVPEVIQQYFLGSLGDVHEDCLTMMESLRSAWGVLSTTEAGKALSHIFRVMKIAIECQTTMKLIVEDGHYLGSVINGSNFTVVCNKRHYRPGSPEQLQDAIRMSGSNAIILGKISMEVGRDQAIRSQIMECTSMWRLRECLQRAAIVEGKKSAILELAAHLKFPQPHWRPNPSSFEKAASYLADGNVLSDYAVDHDLPIHYTSLFSNDKTYVIWSCFGGVAPSFRLPGGQRIDLTGSLEVSIPTLGRGGVARDVRRQVLGQVSLRMVELKLAVEDVQKMISEKVILQVYAIPGARRSQMNRFKAFVGADMQSVISSLREIVRVNELSTSVSSNKRGRDSEGGYEPGKKRRLVDF
jgi:hypothetical protein